jgi:hypothetical protein
MNTSHETIHLSPDDKEKLLEAMESLYQTYLRARSLTPYISESVAREQFSKPPGECFSVSTALLYQSCDYNCVIIFEAEQFDTEEKYKQYQDIGHWINQSFFIELKCIIDAYTSLKDTALADEEHFKLLQQCRHLFAHSSYKLDYKPRKGHEKDYGQAQALYIQLFGNLVKATSGLNLSITDFVIPFYKKLEGLINEKL